MQKNLMIKQNMITQTIIIAITRNTGPGSDTATIPKDKALQVKQYRIIINATVNQVVFGRGKCLCKT